MKLIDEKKLMTAEYFHEALLIRTFKDYQNRGGQRDKFDLYAKIKERAKEHELKYIQYIDMDLNGISVPEKSIEYEFRMAQCLWYALHMIFSVPLHRVSFTAFNLNDFNNL